MTAEQVLDSLTLCYAAVLAWPLIEWAKLAALAISLFRNSAWWAASNAAYYVGYAVASPVTLCLWLMRDGPLMAAALAVAGSDEAKVQHPGTGWTTLSVDKSNVQFSSGGGVKVVLDGCDETQAFSEAEHARIIRAARANVDRRADMLKARAEQERIAYRRELEAEMAARQRAKA